ncbi:MAG: glycosyltransferase family 39 protein [Patescibacteria group bacterium]
MSPTEKMDTQPSPTTSVIKTTANFQKKTDLWWLFSLNLGVTATAIVLNLFASIRLDEAQQVWASTKSFIGILKYISQDVHVPLYAVLLHFWIQIFGTDLAIMRLFSVLFFVLSIPALYIMSRKYGSSNIAKISTSLYCLSPFLTWYSTEIRMYSLLTFVTILSHLTFLKLLKSNTTEGKLLYVLVSSIGLYTHYFFGIVVLMQLTYFILSVLIQKKTTASTPAFKKWKIIMRYFGLLTVVGAAFAPWIIFVYAQGQSANTKPMLETPTSYNILLLFLNFLTGFQSVNIQNSIISIWPLIVILLFLTFGKKTKLNLPYATYFFLMTFGPIALTALISYNVRPILLSRYLIFTTPTLFFLLAVIMAHLNRSVFFAVIGIVFVGNFFFQYQQTASDHIAEKENYKGVAEYLSRSAESFDVIAVTVPFTVYPIEYYYKGKAKIDTIPQWNRYVSGSIPAFTAEDLEKQIGKYHQTYRHMYVVLSYDQGYEDDIKTYLDNNMELQEKRNFSPGLQIRKYRMARDYESNPGG